MTRKLVNISLQFSTLGFRTKRVDGNLLAMASLLMPLTIDDLRCLVRQGNKFNTIFGSAPVASTREEIEAALLDHEAVKVELDPGYVYVHFQGNLQVKHLNLVIDRSIGARYCSAFLEFISDWIPDGLETLKIEVIDEHWSVPPLHKLGRLPPLLGIRSLSVGKRVLVSEHFIQALEDEDPIRKLHELEFLGLLKGIHKEKFARTVLTGSALLRSLTITGPQLCKLFFELIASPSCKIVDLGIVESNGREILYPLADALGNPGCGLLSLRLELDHGMVGKYFFDSMLNSKLQHLTLSLAKERKEVVVEGLEDFLQEPRLQLTSLSLKNMDSSSIDVVKLFESRLTDLSLNFYNLTTLFASSEQLLQLLRKSRLQYLAVEKLDLVPLSEQSKMVDLFFRSDCLLEVLELPRWESQVLQRRCQEILQSNRVYRCLPFEQCRPLSAKLFICGDPGVGKTTIARNLVRRKRITAWFYSPKSTYGIKLQPLSFGRKKLMVCDLAGQQEYHAFHHYFVRGSDKDLFLLVCKAPSSVTDEEGELEKQLRYWLRFIVAHRSSSELKPRVIILLNYFPNSQRPEAFRTLQNLAQIRCNTLIQEYARDHINFGVHPDSCVYGIVATDITQVRYLRDGLQESLTDLLNIKQNVLTVCMTIVDEMNATPRKKVVTFEDFKLGYNLKYFDAEQLEACILYLHDIGELIYFEQEEQQKFVILDVQWFLRDVIGIFLPRPGREQQHDGMSIHRNSMLSIDNVNAQLMMLCDNIEHCPYVLSSLQKLGVVLVDNDHAKVTVLALLKEKLEQWQPTENVSYSFWGRRLDCKDAGRTLLPSGIFNMLQVKLATMFSQHKVGQGWLYLVKNRVHVIVKVGGTRGEWYNMHWIDILVRVPDDHMFAEQGEVLYQDVKSSIINICGGLNWGCPTLELEEKVIRPDLIENNVNESFEEVCHLDEILQEIKDEGTLLYDHTWPSLKSNPIFQLLFPGERRRHFGEKWNQLEIIEAEVSECMSSSNTHEEGGGIEKLGNDTRIVLQRIEKFESRTMGEFHKMRKQMEGLHCQGARILSMLSLHMDFPAPKLPFITNENNVFQTSSQQVFGSTWRLHFLCENHGCCHPVENQPGIKVGASPDWFKRYAPVLVPALRILFFALKVVSIAGLGVAIPTPASAFPKGLKDAGIQAVVEKVFGNIDMHLKSTSPTRAEMEEFHASIAGFLKDKDLEKELGLYKSFQNGRPAWLCSMHRQHALRKVCTT